MKCANCKGKGSILGRDPREWGPENFQCSACNGTGRAAPPLADDGLPEPVAAFTPTGRAVKWDANYAKEPWASGGYKPLYSADQYRQGQRDAVAADRARRAAVPAQTVTQQPAGDSVDTPEFCDLITELHSAHDEADPTHSKEAWAALIDHINTWAGRRAAVSTASADKDAVRYRWWRDNWWNISIAFDGDKFDSLGVETRPGWLIEMKDASGFDSAIDAAIEANAKAGSQP